MNPPALIACGYSEQMAVAALDAGWLYGTGKQPRILPLSFVDTEDWAHGWAAGNVYRLLHLTATHRPAYTVIPDVISLRQLPAALTLAIAVAGYGASPIIVPKVHGLGSIVPRCQRLVFGYSVPTTHGGTDLWAGEFQGRRVHLLGGSPQAQMRIATQLAGATIESADGNMLARIAIRYGKVWRCGKWIRLDAVGERVAEDVPLTALRHSLNNIKQAWERMYSND